MSEGFAENAELSKKVVTIYDLMRRQLSIQAHYDFGMRAIKSVLLTAGRIKRERPNLDEFTVMIKAIRDMNLPKLLAEDVPLFDNMFQDLFPGMEEPEYENDELLLAIEDTLIAHNMTLSDNLAIKIIQLYESLITRHGNMLVGETLAGKSSAWKVLRDALNRLAKEKKDDERSPKVKVEVINPKSVDSDELYGYFDNQMPPQWHDGILSRNLKELCADTKPDRKWMMLDGPVDTLWIESLNSVLDDSKLLTLTNGDRIALSPQVRSL